jgi:transposase
MAKVPAIRLTAAERSELESLAAKMKAPYRDVIRAKMVLWLADGESLSEVARRSGFERTVVRRWRERFIEKRIEGLQDEERSGRPPTFSP